MGRVKKRENDVCVVRRATISNKKRLKDVVGDGDGDMVCGASPARVPVDARAMPCPALPCFGSAELGAVCRAVPISY
jgi:hypothetical protein